MSRYLIALALIMHGLAHAAGFVAAWTANPAGFTSRPWTLPGDIALDSPAARSASCGWWRWSAWWVPAWDWVSAKSGGRP